MMEDTAIVQGGVKRTLDLGVCFSEAWRGFKGWWIPLCIVFALIVVLGHEKFMYLLVHEECARLSPLTTAYQKLVDDVVGGKIAPGALSERYLSFLDDTAELLLRDDIKEAMWDLGLKALYVLLALMVIIGALHVAMIIMSKMAVQTATDTAKMKRDFSRTAVLTCSYLVLAISKVMAFICCTCVIGLYLYGRLICAEFIITDESANPFKAMAKSWRMTRDCHWQVLLIALFAFAMWSFALVSIVGLIPARSFEYTVRAALYRQLKEKAGEAHG